MTPSVATSTPPRDHLYGELAALRALNDELAETARQYKAALVPPLAFPDCWHLTICEARVLAALHAHPRGLTLEALHVAYSNRPDPETDINIVHVALTAVRQKTRRFGVKIDTIRGGPVLSYRLAHGSGDVIDLALAAPCATVWATIEDRKLIISRPTSETDHPDEIALLLPEQVAEQVRKALETWR